ncbi:MAG: TIGR00153 family protein [Chlamydiales bacterium]|nr:TIGR00153 family protein [Chlamydiales bacterium]
MQTLARLFGRSPFKPLQAHMEKVVACVQEITALFKALEKGDFDEVATVSKKISKLEHEADLTKNDIRNNLPTTLFLPIARSSLLDILTHQDSIADRAEDIGILLTLKKLELPKELSPLFEKFVQMNVEVCEGAHKIILEMGQLLESSFGGQEAQKVREMVDSVAYKEHEVDVLQRELLKAFFSTCDNLPAPSFYLWMKVIQELGALSDESEKLANRVRMILEVK